MTEIAQIRDLLISINAHLRDIEALLDGLIKHAVLEAAPLIEWAEPEDHARCRKDQA